jgi:hypothetical protein
VEWIYTNALIAYPQNGFGVRADYEINIASFDLFEKILFHRLLITEGQI